MDLIRKPLDRALPPPATTSIKDMPGLASGTIASTVVSFTNVYLTAALPVALNATPWAEVWVDGERIGETPLGNVPVPIGAHEIVFRHPDLGERRAYATVAVGGPTRVGVDLRAK